MDKWMDSFAYSFIQQTFIVYYVPNIPICVKHKQKYLNILVAKYPHHEAKSFMCTDYLCREIHLLFF